MSVEMGVDYSFEVWCWVLGGNGHFWESGL